LWINAYLVQRNLKVQDLEKDLCDGVLLLYLLEIILKQKLIYKTPKNNSTMHKLDNLTLCINTMEKNGIKSYGFSADDILNGRLKNILAMIWALVCKFGVPSDIDKMKTPVEAVMEQQKAKPQQPPSPQQQQNAKDSSAATTATAVSTTSSSPSESNIKATTSVSPMLNTSKKSSLPGYTPIEQTPTAMSRNGEDDKKDDDDDEDEIEASSQFYLGGRFRVASAETIGVRKTMEDFIKIALNFRGKNDEDVFCIFDGHGSRKPAEYAGENLPKCLESYLEKSGNDTEKALSNAFSEVDIGMSEWAKDCGTTACAALLQGRKLTVANVGDTRAVLCRGGKAIRLSFDHKPYIASEKERIEKAGGFVAMKRVNAVLAVSRALGDSQVKNLVPAEPYTTVTQLQDDDEFLIIACDGVWDILEDQAAVDQIIKNAHSDPLAAAEELRNYAFNNGSNDNISVVIVFFKP